MIESQNIRQILAIMVTDIVDYTETMNNDEAKAWEYLKNKELLFLLPVSKMNGQTFKEMGEGLSVNSDQPLMYMKNTFIIRKPRYSGKN